MPSDRLRFEPFAEPAPLDVANRYGFSYLGLLTAVTDTVLPWASRTRKM